MSFLISLVFGMAVGVAYALSGVKSPAPPLVALFGLLGIVAGEQGVAWLKSPPAPPPELAGPESPTIPTAPGRRTGSAQDLQDRPSSAPPETLR